MAFEIAPGSLMTAVPLPPPACYTCPGEGQAITRAVHQARLSSHYVKCRDCQHREDLGLVSPGWVRSSHLRRRGEDGGLRFTADGIRGRYLNDLNRHTAQRWATALALSIWQARPLPGRVPTDDASTSPLRTQPVIAVGFDERPSSPDLALGVVNALRQAGCRVLDVGQSTAPAWRFAAAQWQVDAAVFVTGSGCDASWTGLDFLGPEQSHVDPSELSVLMPSRSDSVPRPTRFAGSVESISAWPLYESQWAPQFHALRPLRVTAIAQSALVERLLVRLFDTLPCQLTLAARATESPLRWPIALERLQKVLQTEGDDVGVLLGEDGQKVAICDERGQILSDADWHGWLLQSLRVEGTAVAAGACIDAAGRFWHGGERPCCDGILTLATLLRAMSQSDAPLSERLP